MHHIDKLRAPTGETLGTMTTAGIPASGSRGAEMNRTDKPELDDAALASAEQVSDSARNGEAVPRGEPLARGLPANLRDSNGDSLLMLASYHGHLDATRVLLERGGGPQLRHDTGHTPLAGAAFKG